jgi:hypothetical protein
MRIFLSLVILSLLVICGIYVHSMYTMVANFRENTAHRDMERYAILSYVPESVPETPILYDVYINRTLEATFEFYRDALEFAKDKKNASIFEHHTLSWVWDNHPPFELNVNNMRIMHSSFWAAREEALMYDSAYITFRPTGGKIWDSDYTPASSHFLHVPLIHQLPELPRGCEVTSLAALRRQTLPIG